MKTPTDSPGNAAKSKNSRGRSPFKKGNKSFNKEPDHTFNKESKPSFKRGNSRKQWSNNNNKPNSKNFILGDTKHKDFKSRFNQLPQQNNINYQTRDNAATVANETSPKRKHIRFSNEHVNEIDVSSNNVGSENETNKAVPKKSKTNFKNYRKGNVKSPQNKTKSNVTRRKSKTKSIEEKEPNFEDPKAKKKYFYRTVLIGNLPSTVEKAELLKMFSKYGKISNVVLKSLKPNKSKILQIQSFVVFQKRQEALKALELNDTKFKEHDLQVQICDGLKYDQSKAIVVTNLLAGTTENDLWTAFESCGPILSVHLVKNKRKDVTGSAYVNFESASSVERALQMKDVVIKSQAVEIKEQKNLEKKVKKKLKLHEGLKESDQKTESQMGKNKFQKTVKEDKSDEVEKQKLKKKKERIQKGKKPVPKLNSSS